MPISPVPEGRFNLRGSQTVVTLFNSGRHLYMDPDTPHWYEEGDQPLVPLRYKDFCGCGREIYGVHIQHLGHLHGIDGGEARAVITFGFDQWDITIVPCSIYTLSCVNGHLIWFQNRRWSVLPKQLLSLE